MVVRFHTFRAVFKSWEKLLEEAAAFATKVGRDKVISISQSQGPGESIVTVWYWHTEGGAR